MSARQSSHTRNAFPSVRSLDRAAQLARLLARARLRRRAGRTRRRRRRTARRAAAGRRRGRRRSASVSDSVSGTSASVSRNVASSSTRIVAGRARWRSSSERRSVRPVQSSITSSTGRSPATPASRSATAVCRRWRSVSGSASTGGGQLAGARAEIGQQPVSSPPPATERDAQLGRLDRPREAGRAPPRTDRRACARPRRRRRRARGRRRAPPSPANSRTTVLLPEPASPPSRTTRRPSPAAAASACAGGRARP